MVQWGQREGSLPPCAWGWGDRAQMSKYEVIIYWSDEDQAFIADVPELPGCMADGATHQEALTNVEVVIREWIETARELGRPIPEPRGRGRQACGER